MPSGASVANLDLKHGLVVPTRLDQPGLDGLGRQRCPQPRRPAQLRTHQREPVGLPPRERRRRKMFQNGPANAWEPLTQSPNTASANLINRGVFRMAIRSHGSKSPRHEIAEGCCPSVQSRSEKCQTSAQKEFHLEVSYAECPGARREFTEPRTNSSKSSSSSAGQRSGWPRLGSTPSRLMTMKLQPLDATWTVSRRWPLAWR